jgi:hypothetical protein
LELLQSLWKPFALGDLERSQVVVKMKTLKCMKFNIYALFVIFLCSSCGDKSVTYSDQSLKLIEPVEIISWAMFADGGSIQITFKDSTGKDLTFYYDQSGEGRKENRNIYIGKLLSPKHEGNKRVPIGSPVEKEIVKYVSKWMESQFPEYKNDPNKMYMSSSGKIISSAAILGLIQDLQQGNR